MTVETGAQVLAKRNPDPDTPDTVHCAFAGLLKTLNKRPVITVILNR